MEGLWPIIVLWVLLALFGRKKRPQAPSPPRAAGGGEVDLRQQLPADLAQAIEKLRRAGQRSEREPARERGVAAEPRRDRVVRRPVRPLEDDDADKSSEVETVEASPEVRDYDEEAAAIAARRIELARQREREDEAVQGLSSAQLERRGERQAAVIGGAREHKEWHQRAERAGAPSEPRAVAAWRGALSRYADGTMRSAIVLSEILGRPKSLL